MLLYIHRVRNYNIKCNVTDVRWILSNDKIKVISSVLDEMVHELSDNRSLIEVLN